MRIKEKEVAVLGPYKVMRCRWASAIFVSAHFISNREMNLPCNANGLGICQCSSESIPIRWSDIIDPQPGSNQDERWLNST